jgi:hypothetical protein
VAREDTAKLQKLLNTGKYIINLQEAKFGNTLLMLAVSNDKPNSVEVLLKNGANVHLRDLRDDQVIHQAVQYINLKKHTFQILQLLLQYGADVNAVSTKGSYSVPIQGAVEDSNCAKLLLAHGANIYYRNKDSDYVVWSDLCSYQFDNIYMARYLIIDRKMAVPNPILFTYHSHEPRDIFTLLEILPCNNPKPCQVKDEIEQYLNSQGFPEKGAYK